MDNTRFKFLSPYVARDESEFDEDEEDDKYEDESESDEDEQLEEDKELDSAM